MKSGTLTMMNPAANFDQDIQLRSVSGERRHDCSASVELRRGQASGLQNNGLDRHEIVISEFKLPKLASLVIIIAANAFLQVSFFIIISSSNAYAEHLGGTSTFSGVVIGIPTVFSGLALIPMMKFDGGGYSLPLHISCAASILGHILYALAYRASFLYLILVGRIVSGFGFAMWMYCKRYCSDPRIVGIRYRTTLASWLVIGQCLGMSLGPFSGGLLYKIGFKNSIFNGYTSPGWIMAAVWSVFWLCVTLWFEDIPKEQRAIDSPPIASTPSESENVSTPPPRNSSKIFSGSQMRQISRSQWAVVVCMCWFAIVCWFTLGAWESNLPVLGANLLQFHWSPFAAGNFIALGGITTFPFVLVNLFLAKRVQDRKILAFGSSLGLSALLVFLSLVRAQKLSYGSLFASWAAVAIGFNLASTVTLSLLSKQLPPSWNGWTSLAIQYSNYTGRVTGAIWGGSGVRLGLMNYVACEIVLVGIGGILFIILWHDLRATTG